MPSPLPDILRNAVAHHRAGRLVDAESSYRQVLHLDPGQPDANHNLGAALGQQGRLAEAAPLLMRALELAPERPKYWSVCLDVLQAKGDLTGAVALYRRLLAAQPGLATAHFNLGNLLVRLDQPGEAAASFRQALRLDPRLAQAHNNLGNLLKLEGRLAEAQEQYRAALQTDPGLVDARVNLGSVLEQQGQLADAEAAFRLAREKSPDHPNLDRQLGAVLAEQGRTAEALEAFLRHARRTSPPEPTEHQHRHDQEQRSWRGGAAVEGLHLEGGGRVDGAAVNPRDDNAVVTAQWQADPKVAVIDDLLTQEALAALRRLCLGSNFWRSSFANGYLGALPEHGFAAPLLAQIGEELPRVYPEIFGRHPLLQLWAFKYDSALSGINLHADFAAVNVNFWITPDEANLDPDHGGLVVWDKAAPLDWDFARYNADEAAMRAMLEQSGAKAVTIPYRANRAVIFDSDLFHETDRFRFRPGYENRRINITYLYGWRRAGTRI